MCEFTAHYVSKSEEMNLNQMETTNSFILQNTDFDFSVTWF